MADNCCLCNDLATRLLPCGHTTCDLCLKDLELDGNVCKISPEDCEEMCNVLFSADEVVEIQSNDSPGASIHWCKTCQTTVDDKHAEHEIVALDQAIQAKKDTMQEKAEQLTQDIGTLNQLASAIWEHNGATLRSMSDEGQRQQANKAIEADIKAIQLKRDQLVVHCEHFRLARTITRMQQLEQQHIDRRLPILQVTELAKQSIHTLFPSLNLTRFGRDYTKIMGRPVRVFGREGHAEGQLYGPRCLCFDKYNNILVVDWHNRIQVFSREGHFLRTFHSDIDSDMAGLALTPRRQCLGIALRRQSHSAATWNHRRTAALCDHSRKAVGDRASA